MNSVYFFLPFLLVASLGIYQQSFAAETVTGYDYFDTDNKDGTHRWQTHEPYIFDGANYVPFIYSGNNVETEHGSISVNNSFSFYNKGHIADTPLFTDTIIAKYADISNLNSWTYLNTLNSATPTSAWDGNSFTISKTKSGIGLLDYKYVLNNGKWKTQLEATNLSSLTTKAFGFDQIVDLNSDTIQFGGVTRNLDQLNGTTFYKTFLVNNQGKILNLLNGINFDFDLGFTDLYSVTVYDTGANKSRLVFDYRTNTALLPNQKIVIDPTYGYTSGTSEGTYYTNGACTAYAATYADTLSGGDGVVCYYTAWEWNTSSIPDLAIINNATLRYDVTADNGSPIVDLIGITSKPSTTADATTTTEIITVGNYYGAGIQSTVGNDYTIQLVGNATRDIKNNLSGDFFAMSWRKNPNNNANLFYRTNGMDLTIDYTALTNPDRILNLSNSTNPTATTIGINWTAPSPGNGSQYIIGYMINMTTPQTNTPLLFINDTGTTTTNYNFTGLLFGTDYSTSVLAWANNTYGHPSYNSTIGNVFNFTTATNTFSPGPTNFLMFPNGTSTSILNLNWTAPTLDNLNGYRIQCEAPVGGGFSTILSNSSTPGTRYNYTGLVINTYYNCKVAGLNSSGITGYSNTYSQTTYHLPDSVISLTVTMSDALSAMLTWVQPATLYGYLTGYQINYTTPLGDPQIIHLESTGSSSLSYTVGGLTSDPYSFRVSAITIHGKNTTNAAITNGTAVSNFEVGSVYLPTGTNPNTIPIAFEHHTINSTSTDVKVIYDSSYNLACDFSYPISQSNTTYTGLTENPIAGSEVYSNFTLNGYGNSLVDIYCWDQSDNSTNGRDRIGTSSIPLVGQINSFQTGSFGTSGKFGALDLMTLMVVIVSMIGFNRTHPIVGVSFMVVFIGAMTYYHVIAEQTTYLGATALVIALAIIYGRRDDAE